MINRPNILMIMTDNQPADMLGCYGNDEVLTPHIDQLAAAAAGFGLLAWHRATTKPAAPQAAGG